MTTTEPTGTETTTRYGEHRPDRHGNPQNDLLTALASQHAFTAQDRRDAAAMLLRHAEWQAHYINADQAEVANLLAMADLHLRLAATSPAAP